MKRFQNISSKLKSILLILLLATGQVATATGPFIPLQKASAAPICVVDTAGANDLSGQKDLTKLCVDYAGVPTTVSTVWNWDELGTSGSNSLDACSLFDTDSDGNVNYAVCVTTTGTPATLQNLTTYSCGDDKINRCTSTATVISNGTTSCTVTQQSTDPFPAGDASPLDTQAACTIQLSTVGGAAAKLIDVCSYPSQQPNSSPSDCVIARSSFGKVELVKDIVPNTDTGLFNLIINGPELADTTTVNNLGDNGTTGEVVVKGGTVVVSEAAGTSTALSSYSTAISCRDLNGTGTVLATGSPTGALSRQLSFTLAADADVVCTITNTRQTGTITLIKNVIKDSGGTAGVNDFGLTIGGVAVTSGQTQTLAPNSYAINEVGLAGYSFVNITGTGCPATLGGNVVLTNGQNITCTITNDDQPGTLTVNKVVINDNGGAAQASNFSFTKTADATNYNFVNGATTLVGSKPFTVNAGTYSAVESSFTGYTMTGNTCTNVVVANGSTANCTITNNDNAPALTLVKLLGTMYGSNAVVGDWNLTATGSSPTPTNLSGSTGTTGATSSTNFKADTYTLGETGLSGFTASWNCIGGNALSPISLTIAISLGQNVTCTVTNTAIQPKLTVTKVVNNDNGGTKVITDFPLTVNGTPVTSGIQNGFNVGTYTVAETSDAGYTAVISGDCNPATGSITLALADVKTCTITNNDNAPKLHLRKVVTNNSGGSATVASFTLTANGAGTNDISGTSPVDSGATLLADTFALSETNPGGYTASAWVCTGNGTQNGANITLGLGQEATCTITNDDQQSYIIVNKTVTNNNGGSASPNDFNLTVNGNAVFDEVAYPVNPGTHTVGETNLSGYTAGAWGSDCAANATVTVALGETKTCTITNDDVAPSLTLDKIISNLHGGTAVESNWNLTATGPTTITGAGAVGNADVVSEATFSAGTYTLSESTGPIGYSPSSWTCTGSVVVNGNSQITLANGQTTVCTITNSDIAPILTVTKTVLNPFGNPLLASAFPLFVDGTSLTSGVSTTQFDAGTYTITETQQTGYQFTSIDGACTLDATVISVVLSLAGSYTCTITNTAIQPKLIVIKHVVNDNGGQNDADDFTMTVAGNSLTVPDFAGAESPGTTVYLNEGNYLVDELPVAGYTKTLGSDCAGTITIGQTKTCTITNDDQQSYIIVNKTVDNLDGGSANPDDFNLTVDGNAVFDEVAYPVNPGTHTVGETNLPGYTQGEWGQDCNAAGSVTVALGETKTCTITNDDNAAQLTLVKSNNRPNATIVGDTVTYTLVASLDANGGALYGTTVTDLPPAGFVYVPGSWTAVSSLRGNLRTLGVTTQPPYGSPGTWQLGDLLPGEIVTLTYLAKIASSVSDGAYSDIAFAQGDACGEESQNCDEDGMVVYSNVHRASSPFVDTKVTVSSPKVLGANILVNTGSPLAWAYALTATMLMAAGIATTRRRNTVKGGAK